MTHMKKIESFSKEIETVKRTNGNFRIEKHNQN